MNIAAVAHREWSSLFSLTKDKECIASESGSRDYSEWLQCPVPPQAAVGLMPHPKNPSLRVGSVGAVDLFLKLRTREEISQFEPASNKRLKIVPGLTVDLLPSR
jgi:hypothetical protein